MKPMMVVGGLAVLAIVLLSAEWLFPLRKRTRRWLPRLGLNLILAAIAFLVAWLVVRPAAAATAQWGALRGTGLVTLLPLPPLAHAVLGFLLMDLTFYYWHLLNHRVGFLWRFHNIHHIDPDLDISTAVRFHFFELLLSTGFRIFQVGALGIPAGIYFLYEVIFQANTLFQHSNLRLPIGVERALNWILVTPRMHGIHHSTVREESDSDYSSVFSWWDRLHGTLRLNVPQNRLTIGVPGYLAEADNSLWNCLRVPFQRQRDYWRLGDGAAVERDASQLRGPQTRLAA